MFPNLFEMVRGNSFSVVWGVVIALIKWHSILRLADALMLLPEEF
jgi:hypothetical protein